LQQFPTIFVDVILSVIANFITTIYRKSVSYFYFIFPKTGRNAIYCHIYVVLYFLTIFVYYQIEKVHLG